MQYTQMQFGQIMTPMVKKLIIANVSIWIGGVLILQNLFSDTPWLFNFFGMSPSLVVEGFHIWQPVTYMFLHAGGVFHILFNMFMLWWLGSELERHWGSRFFTTYYFICGIGAAGLYILCIYVYYVFSGNSVPLSTPVIGASASVYGLFLAYGLLFGERIVLVLMMFPMKAKHFVMLLGGIELVSLLNSGLKSSVAHLAHLGGLVAGLMFLWGSTHWRRLKREGAFDTWGVQNIRPPWRRKASKRPPRLTVVKSLPSAYEPAAYGPVDYESVTDESAAYGPVAYGPADYNQVRPSRAHSLRRHCLRLHRLRGLGLQVFLACIFVLYGVEGVCMSSRIEFQVEKHQLKNGLTVLLHQDESTPLVTLHQWFRVGSSYERPGIRGLAHFFEHLMFKGTKRFSKNAFDLLVQSYGGENNAFTSLDYTGYYVSMPSGNLEKLLDVEADRMQNLQLTPDNIRTEREVVKEERRYSIDNSVSGQIQQTLFELLFGGSSYEWPIIGYMKDLNQASKTQLNQFYKTYYAPNNAVLVLAGKFNKKQVLKWVNKYYAPIRRQKIKTFSWQNPKGQKTTRRRVLKKNIQSARGVVAFVSAPAGAKEAYALDLLASILAGDKSSRLYQNLVYKGQRVTSVSSYNYSPQRSGVFSVEWSMKPGLGLDASLKSIRGELYKARTQLVTPEELERAKNTVLFDYVSSLQSLGGKAYALALNEVVMGDYKYLFSDLDRYTRITAEDIRLAAQKYLTPARRNELRIVPQ